MKIRASIIVALMAASVGSVVAGDRPPAPIASIPQVGQDGWAVAQKREFGSATVNIMQIPAASFRPEYSSGKFSWTSVGYFGPDSDSGSGYLWAPLVLPTGVRVCWMNAYYSNTNPSANISFYLYRTTGGAGNTPGIALLASTASTASTSFGYASAAVEPDFQGNPGCHTINNDAHSNANGGQYFIEVFFQGNPDHSYSGLAFRGVDVWWQRQISPAPTTATFADVPTTHIFFQHVEALKASGITTGTSPTTFSPDATVTRGQMAAFLARALGLHWDH